MLEADAHDTGKLPTLGGIHRKKGALAVVCDAYHYVSRLSEPDRRKVVWLDAVLRGDRVPHLLPQGLWPAPFVRIVDFLSSAEASAP